MGICVDLRNQRETGSFEHLNLKILDLFRISKFGFRIFLFNRNGRKGVLSKN